MSRICSFLTSKLVIAGARGTGCCGSVIDWGVTTAYKKCQTLLCTQQICPN